jgi:hypothetical protein
MGGINRIWIALPALFLMGSVYSFPIWFPSIKKTMGLSQVEMNGLGIGIYLSTAIIGFQPTPWISGMCPRTMAILSCVCVTVGNLIFYLIGDDSNYGVAFFGTLLLLGPSTWLFVIILANQVDDRGRENSSLWTGLIGGTFAVGGLVASVVLRYGSVTLNTFFLGLTVASGAGVVLSIGMSCVRGNGFETRKFEYGKTIYRAIQTRMYWVVIVLLFIQFGVTTTLMTNMGTIAISAGEPEEVGRLGIIMAGSQVVSRVGVACFGYRFPGNVVPVGAIVVSSVCNTVMVTVYYYVQTLGTLMGLGTVVGVSYGLVNASIGGLVTLIVTDRNDDFGTLAAIVFPAGSVGTVVFNVVSGVLYDREQSVGADCVGEICYQTIMVWFAWLSGISVLLGVGVLYGSIRATPVPLGGTEMLLIR